MRSEIDLDAALLEALAILLDDSTPRLVGGEFEMLGTGPINREPAAVREARACRLERRLAERGGWDEV